MVKLFFKSTPAEVTFTILWFGVKHRFSKLANPVDVPEDLAGYLMDMKPEIFSLKSFDEKADEKPIEKPVEKVEVVEVSTIPVPTESKPKSKPKSKKRGNK